MKSYRPDVVPEPLFDLLCVHFRLDPEKITYIEKVEMLYVYDYVRVSRGLLSTTEILAVVGELQKLYHDRSKRKRLYKLYQSCKLLQMVNSGRYDTTTQKPPSRPNMGYYY